MVPENMKEMLNVQHLQRFPRDSFRFQIRLIIRGDRSWLSFFNGCFWSHQSLCIFRGKLFDLDDHSHNVGQFVICPTFVGTVIKSQMLFTEYVFYIWNVYELWL